METPERILVTGAAGYVAKFLIPELRKRGHHLVGVDRKPMDHVDLDRTVQGDLADPYVCESALEDIDMVYHLAAAKGDWGISEEEYFHDNLEATDVLLDVGQDMGVHDWFFYSTVSVLGPSDEALDEEADLQPVIPYGKSKAKAEKLFWTYAEDVPSARIMILRPSAIYGPENPPETNIYRLIDAIERGHFVMVGKGEALKTTSHMDNLIAATLFLQDRLFADPEPRTETFIYVDNPVMPTRDLVDTIYRLLGKKPPSFYLPLGLAKTIAQVSDVAADLTGIDFPITAARIEKFCTSTYFDASALRATGFEQPVSNEDALARTVDWHLKEA